MSEMQILRKQDTLIPQSMSEKILTVGTDHRNYKGGIGYLIHVYSQHFASFKSVTTHKLLNDNKFDKILLIPYFLKQYVLFLHQLATDRQLRIVHMHGSSYGSFYRELILFLTAKYVFRKKTIYHMHGSEFAVFYRGSNPLTKRLIHLLIENVDAVVCLSKSWHQFFTDNFRLKRIEIIGNVVNAEPQKIGSRREQTHEPLTCLFLGAIGHRKGIFDLLDVLRQHKPSLEGRLRVVIGGNGETERLTAYIQEHRLEQMAQFVGWISGPQKHQLLSESDLYILPSYNEGLPLSILEAMSYRLPVISTPVGGTAEAVQEGVNGFLVPPGDKAALYDRLLRFIAQPDLIVTMGNASGQIIRQYQPETIFPKLQTLYESLLTHPT